MKLTYDTFQCHFSRFAGFGTEHWSSLFSLACSLYIFVVCLHFSQIHLLSLFFPHEILLAGQPGLLLDQLKTVLIKCLKYVLNHYGSTRFLKSPANMAGVQHWRHLEGLNLPRLYTEVRRCLAVGRCLVLKNFSSGLWSILFEFPLAGCEVN